MVCLRNISVDTLHKRDAEDDDDDDNNNNSYIFVLTKQPKGQLRSQQEYNKTTKTKTVTKLKTRTKSKIEQKRNLVQYSLKAKLKRDNKTVRDFNAYI